MQVDAMNAALGGLQRNQQAFANHAHRIANSGPGGSAGGPEVNLADEMVGVMMSRRGYEANLPVLRAADGMLGTLLDMLA